MTTNEDLTNLTDEEQSIVTAVHKAQMEAIEKFLSELIESMERGKLLALTVTDLKAMLAEIQKRE